MLSSTVSAILTAAVALSTLGLAAPVVEKEDTSPASILTRGDSCSNYNPMTVGRIDFSNGGGTGIAAYLQFSYDSSNWYTITDDVLVGGHRTLERDQALSGIARDRYFKMRICDRISGGTSCAGVPGNFRIPSTGKMWVATIAAENHNLFFFRAVCDVTAEA